MVQFARGLEGWYNERACDYVYEICLAKVDAGKKPVEAMTLGNSSKIRLIGSNGEALGIVTLEEAKRVADSENLDLVIVAKDANPPVCKVLDYGKYKYEQQKKKAESRKKQKTVDLKEIQIRPFIGENDLMVKCKALKRFIEAGNKVKLVMRFRGREMSRQDIGKEVIQKVIDFCREFAKPETPPKLEGTMIVTILSGKQENRR